MIIRAAGCDQRREMQRVSRGMARGTAHVLLRIQVQIFLTLTIYQGGALQNNYHHISEHTDPHANSSFKSQRCGRASVLRRL